jgi:multiple antibiotic resistance protein
LIWSDLSQLAGAVFLVIGAVLPVVNPLGDAPIFLRMTPGCDETTRALLAGRIAFYSFCFVLGSLLFGSFVLAVFGLSLPVVQVAGGAVVCALAWNVLADVPKPAEAALAPAQARLIALGRAITPLTLPMTIDAGVIALSILLTYRYAHRVSGKIGQTGMIVLIRLYAFIMLCIGVGISWDGIKSLLAEVGIHG